MKPLGRLVILFFLALFIVAAALLSVNAISPATSVNITPSSSFAYVPDPLTGVYAYAIDDKTGALTMLAGSPFPAGFGSEGATVDPSNKFLYVADQRGGVFGFKIDQTSGSLSTVSGSPFPAGDFIFSLAVHPSGRFLCALSFAFRNISVFSINNTTGALTEVPGSPFATGIDPSDMAIDPSGRYLYVINDPAGVDGASTISGYAIDPLTGVLSNLAGSPFKEKFDGRHLGLDPSGAFLYVANGNSASVSAFKINRNGGLKQIAGSPFPSGNLVVALATNPSGRFVYVGAMSDSDIWAYSIDSSSGALSAITGSPFKVDFAPFSLTANASGGLLYATDESGTGEWGFLINSQTGALTPIPGSPFSAGQAPYAIATTSGFLTFPIAGIGPQTAGISSIFDHSQSAPYSNKTNAVSAYTGEIGVCDPNNAAQNLRSLVGTKNLSGLRKPDGSAFFVNGNYTGGASGSNSPAETCAGVASGSSPSDTFLFYQGHPGYDYPQSCETGVYAAASGTVFYPTTAIPGYGIAALKKFHVLELDLDNPRGFKIYYLHMTTYPNAGSNAYCLAEPPIIAGDPKGVHVEAGQLIGRVGHAGLPCAGDTCAHLHFEVRNRDGVAVDPYGWTGIVAPGFDPYPKKAINKRLWNNSQ